MKASDNFMNKLSEMEEAGRVSPVIQDDGVSYIYIQYSNLYLLALSRNNSNAVAIIAFLHKLVQIFKHYFREVSGCWGGWREVYRRRAPCLFFAPPRRCRCSPPFIPLSLLNSWRRSPCATTL